MSNLEVVELRKTDNKSEPHTTYQMFAFYTNVVDQERQVQLDYP
jgi:hypothetical protein